MEIGSFHFLMKCLVVGAIRSQDLNGVIILHLSFMEGLSLRGYSLTER
jgi:hypothetical protein